MSMPRSMTGYGRGMVLRHDRKIQVEMKSVNHRYNDITIKMPRMLGSFEEPLRKQLSRLIARGKVDVYVSMESFSKDDVSIQINVPLAAGYLEALAGLKDMFALPDSPTLAMVAQYPDVLKAEKKEAAEETLAQIWETLTEAADVALAQFMQMREAEGNALVADILGKQKEMQGIMNAMKTRQPAVAAEYEKRLRTRMEELLASATVDENRLLAEVAVFAERSAIDEEITRFESHLVQLEQILQQEGALGRKLDFLVQEMNREANTIGSKANDLELTKAVVELKCLVEKVREQVQNIE